MKSTGIVRRVDELGRIVIPMEIRRVMEIQEKDGMEIYVDDDRIILRKYQPSCGCIFCGNEAATNFKGKPVCKDCIDSMKPGGEIA